MFFFLYQRIFAVCLVSFSFQFISLFLTTTCFAFACLLCCVFPCVLFASFFMSLRVLAVSACVFFHFYCIVVTLCCVSTKFYKLFILVYPYSDRIILVFFCVYAFIAMFFSRCHIFADPFRVMPRINFHFFLFVFCLEVCFLLLCLSSTLLSSSISC